MLPNGINFDHQTPPVGSERAAVAIRRRSRASRGRRVGSADGAAAVVAVRLKVRPLTLAQANEFVAAHHRHHKKVVGHRLSLGAFDGERLCGVVIVGRPVARMVDPYLVAEVTRLCTDGTRNACSFLYASAARVCRAMGFTSIQTYTLPEEGGASLRASGWTLLGESGGGDWNRGGESTHKNRRTDQPMGVKHKWQRELFASDGGAE